MSEDPKPFPALLAELQAAYQASLGTNVKAITIWSKLVDKHAGRIFEEIAGLQNGLEKAAQIILEKEKEYTQLAMARAAVEAKLAECELRAANEFRGRSQLLKEKDDRIIALQAGMKAMDAECRQKLKQAENEIGEFSLTNLRLAKKIELLSPGSMRSIQPGKPDQAPAPMSPPSLIGAALKEKFGVFADIARNAAGPFTPPDYAPK